MPTFNILLSVFVLGLTFGSGPCLASCGPMLISYVAGTKKTGLRGLGVYFIFTAARVSVYIALAILAFFFGNIAFERILGDNLKYITIAGGLFIIFIGLLIASGRETKLKYFHMCSMKMLERDTKSIIALGLFAGILPCGPLIAVLSYIALVSKTWMASLFYSLSFGLGTFFSPLILLVIFSGFLPVLAQKSVLLQRVLSFVCGLVIIFLGLQLLRRVF